MDVPVAANVLGTLGAVCLSTPIDSPEAVSDLVVSRFVGLFR
jgi:hypothetical protein